MLKQRKFNISETNIALLGSDLEKKARLDASQHEPAWKTAGKAPGLEVWRIEKFKVVPWPKEKYGSFFNGDSYIVLNTYKKGDNQLGYDVHFWLGNYTSQDEAGTAAYKTVELDDHLGTLPVQHREVQGYESALFLSYFHNTIHVVDGGVDTGFKHWQDADYKPKLFHVVGQNNRDVRIIEVPASVDSLNGGDVFVLDAGKTIYQWNGHKSGIFEKSKAGWLTRKLDDERKTAAVKVTDQGDKDEAEFFRTLGASGAVSVSDTAKNPPATAQGAPHGFVKKLFSLSDASGKLVLNEIASGANVKRSALNSNDAFILDSGDEVVVWIGKGASVKERRFALQYANQYLHDQKRPGHLPISRVVEGSEGPSFLHHLH
jgi:gelsolin